ncbi:MAG: hypothetical protein GWO20_18440, partial [Candidatus Korarchaeota archaeon]|nr:hypothetical protein [Candidatus Korarchaeota archaeon]NIU85276.1 hypothetical protein [Candidatus Thorarchaeota archaeon]NIW15373.1 hypothetical protein [Candidatus Thorarchaeota archaeon]NIW53320.1 hypothetical protein [Candidatus Korarchaeota archaeon]
MERSIIPGERTTIPIRVWNKTGEHLTGLLRISDISHVNFESKSFPIDLQPNERRTLAVHLQLEHRVRRKQNLQLHLHFYKIENGTSVNVCKQTIFIPIIDTPVGKGNACNGYIVEGKKAILENRPNRLEFTLEPPYFLHELIDKRSNERFQVDSLAPDLGLPFEGETGELARKKQHLRLFHKKECTSLVFSSTSQKKKGLEVKREFTLCPDSNFIKVNVSLINHSNQSHDSVGWRYFGEPWSRFAAEGVQYLPLTWGILRVQNGLDFSQEVHFPRNAEKWRESWTCFEFSDNKLFGLLWDPKHVEKVRVRTLDVPSLQYAFETIAPGEKEEVTFYLFLGRGTWRDFRTYWKQIVLHDSSVQVPPEHPEVINELSLTTESSTFGTEQAFNIQPIATSDTLTVVIRNNTLRVLKGELSVQLPEELSFLDGQRRSKEPFE